MRKYVDVTITLMVPVDGDIRKEHDEAVDKALNYIEKSLGQNPEGIEVMDTNIEWVS